MTFKYTVEVHEITTVATRYEIEAEDTDEAVEIARAIGHETDSIAAALNAGVTLILAHTADTKVEVLVRHENPWGLASWSKH